MDGVCHHLFDCSLVEPVDLLFVISVWIIRKGSAQQLIDWINGLWDEEAALFRALNSSSGRKAEEGGPHISMSKQDALSQLQAIQTPTNKKYIKICHELHEDGQPHLHVLVQFEGRFRCINNSVFNLVSRSRSSHHHPNIQGANPHLTSRLTSTRTGTPSNGGEFQIDGRSARGGPQSVNDAYAATLNTSNKATAVLVIREQVPRDFVRDYPTLDSNFERIFNPIQNNIFISKWDPSSFRVPDDLEQWVGEHFNKIFINADDQEGNNPAARPSKNNRYVLKPDVDRP
ncbi:hypothetical protein Ancab_015025 [Ancistrocladus abbreviatus]